MRNNIGDKARLQHIYDAILEIESYVQKSSYEAFQSNMMMQFACVKQLEIIGEAANRLSSHFKKFYSEIQWRVIIDLINLLIVFLQIITNSRIKHYRTTLTNFYEKEIKITFRAFNYSFYIK